MESVIVSSKAQLTLAAAEQAEQAVAATDNAEPSGEPFIATIVQLDQTAAEQLFRAAKL